MFEPDENELNKNDTLFTDIVVQLMGGWFSHNTKIVNAVCESVSEEMGENPGALPGILFGCILHMTTMLTKMAEERGISVEEMWSEYLLEYNTVIRERMARIPLLHPEIAKKASENLE